MKPNRILPGLVCLSFFALILTAHTEPRDTLPPWPEQTLGIWGFNESLTPSLPSRAAIGSDSAKLAESWSGYALVRDVFTVSPVAIPVMDSFYHKRNFTTTEGTVRFWFRPDFSGANAGGNGPGTLARLLELVALSGKEPETLWSLYFNPEGSMLYLSGMGVGGPTDFLKAEVTMEANQWHLISLSYDEKQTTLMVDAVVVATGSAFPPVASWKADALALLIGSDITGANPAQGWLDEVCTFDYVQAQDDVMWYWKSARWVVMLGAVGTEKEEWAKQQWVHKLWVEEYGEPEVTPTVAYRSRPEEYPTNALWLDISEVTNGVVLMRLQGTVPDVMYEILSQVDLGTNAGWQSEGVWIGTADQDWTETPVQVGTRTNQLFMKARSWKDEDGNGLPDWWEMQEFGQTGTDGYADPDGDGWVNLQEYQNGTSPNGFNSSPGPANFTAMLGASGTNVVLGWTACSSSVIHYVIERADYDSNTGGYGTFNAIAQVNGNTTSFQDTGAFTSGSPDSGWNEPTFILPQNSLYRIHAVYGGGNSGTTEALLNVGDPALAVTARLVRNASGRWQIVCSALPEQVKALQLNWFLWDYYWDVGIFLSTKEVAVSNLTAGVYTIPDSDILDYWGTGIPAEVQVLWVRGKDASSHLGAATKAGVVQLDSPYFVDGREHLRQNLSFFITRGDNHPEIRTGGLHLA